MNIRAAGGGGGEAGEDHKHLRPGGAHGERSRVMSGSALVAPERRRASAQWRRRWKRQNEAGDGADAGSSPYLVRVFEVEGV